jgi:protein gp37
MAEETNISWADATLNFFVGCTKVSVGPQGACENCYAETWANRWPQYRETWGPGAPRVQFKHMLAKAMKLERLAIARKAAGGGAYFCFSNSLSDIFDNEVPIEWLREAFDIMRATPHVTYLLLTKRPQNILKRFAATLNSGLGTLSDYWPRNVAIGCTAVTQKEADRDLPWLLIAKKMLSPAFAFVSMEPLMEAVDLTPFLYEPCPKAEDMMMDPSTGAYECCARCDYTGISGEPREDGIDWVITGGESGTQARPTLPDAFRSLRDQCATAGLPFHFKQWGEWAPGESCPDLRARDCADLINGEWVFDRVPAGASDDHIDDEPLAYRVGTKASGRLLDGVLHDARPVPA